LKTIVYVDGYNLYYGLLRRSAFKWLDLHRLFQEHALGPDADVVEVRYYTAPVLGRMSDDPESSQRQRTYLQALRKMPPNKVTIIEGKIMAETPVLRLVSPLSECPGLTCVKVHNFTEKKTDVNLAADLITGAWSGAYEQAVICSNDTDLEGALRAVKENCPLVRLGLVAPIPSNDSRRIAADLKKYADWSKVLSTVHLEHAQLPEKIPGTALWRPECWR
jgi:uncharacterized LabA/DUF88 family protein